MSSENEKDRSFTAITSACTAFFDSKESDKSSLWILSTVMDDVNFPMHNYAHHYLVPALLLAAVCRAAGTDREQFTKYLAEAEKRAKNVLPAFCGYYGACGAAIGCGIFMSVYTGTTPLSQETWSLCNQATAGALSKMAEIGGPRCCKRNTFIALTFMKNYIQISLSINVDIPDAIECSYSKYNNECLKEKCPFYTEKENCTKCTDI